MKVLVKSLLCAFGMLLLASQIEAQCKLVKVDFEIDGKRVEEKFRVLLYVNGTLVEPLRFENGFVVPPIVDDYPAVDVRLLFGGYKLDFSRVSRAQFGANWRVGIDRKPPFRFAEVTNQQLIKPVKLAYYLKFETDKGDPVMITVTVPKKSRRRR